jgi:hypothetical protein
MNANQELVKASQDQQALIDQLRADNAALVAAKNKPRAISLKVSQKGALSLYGLGRFPVTLYKEQWFKVLDIATDIKTFIAENDADLKSKADSVLQAAKDNAELA